MYCEKLLEELRLSVREIVGRENSVAVAYSGGMDSSIIAALASEIADVKCYSAVVPGSHDALNVKANADQEKRLLETVVLSDELLIDLVATASALVGSTNAVPIAYTIPLIAVIGIAGERTILAGNGADELFGGYAKYLTSSDPRKQMEADLGKAISEAKTLERYSLERGKMIGLPFLSNRVQELARSMPLDQKIRGTSRKLVLIDIANELNLHSGHRQKKAAQYSSGVLKRMQKLAKADGKTSDAWVASIRNSD